MSIERQGEHQEADELNKAIKAIRGDLESLKAEQIDAIFRRFKEEPEYKNLSLTQKQKLLKSIAYIRDAMGLDFTKAILFGQPYEGQTINIPFSELKLFLEAVLEEIINKDLKEVEAIIITLDELKQLRKAITIEQIRMFLREQIKENISSYNIFAGTKLEQIFGKEKLQTLTSRLDSIFFNILESHLPQAISNDVKRNMATGLTLHFFEVFNGLTQKEKEKFVKDIGSLNLSENNAIDILKNILAGNSKTKDYMSKIIDFTKIFEDENLLKQIGDGEKNKILTNPVKFKQFIDNLTPSNTKQARQELLANNDQSYVFQGLNDNDKQAISTFINNLTSSQSFNATNVALLGGGFSEGINKLNKQIVEFKQKGKELAFSWGDTIVGLKKLFDAIGIGEGGKKFIEFFLKFFGFESYEDFENEYLIKEYEQFDAEYKKGIEQLPKDKREFVEKIRNKAQEIADELGIPVSLVIGQAGLESNWGRSQLATKYNNLFGIKAGKNRDGQVAQLSTKEHVGGKEIQINDKFRAYNNRDDSIEDYKKLLMQERYQEKLRKIPPEQRKKDIKAVAKALKEAGYATDVAYVRKLSSASSQVEGMLA